ncbi:MAG: hypothetical protein R6V67_11160 [Spirochaetia bacterium]
MEYTNSGDQSWLIMGFIIFGFIILLAVMRNIESRRVYKKFDNDSILLTGFGVNYFGLSSEPGKPLRSAGSLVLLKDGLYYRARILNREVFIPGDSISGLEVVDYHKGINLHQKALAVNFRNKEKGSPDRAVFRIPYPNNWITAIRGVFILPKEQASKEGDRNGGGAV